MNKIIEELMKTTQLVSSVPTNPAVVFAWRLTKMYNEQASKVQDRFWPNREELSFDNYITGVNSSGRGATEYNFVLSDGKKSGIQAEKN